MPQGRVGRLAAHRPADGRRLPPAAARSGRRDGAGLGVPQAATGGSVRPSTPPGGSCGQPRLSGFTEQACETGVERLERGGAREVWSHSGQEPSAPSDRTTAHAGRKAVGGAGSNGGSRAHLAVLVLLFDGCQAFNKSPFSHQDVLCCGLISQGQLKRNIPSDPMIPIRVQDQFSLFE